MVSTENNRDKDLDRIKALKAKADKLRLLASIGRETDIMKRADETLEYFKNIPSTIQSTPADPGRTIRGIREDDLCGKK